MEEWEEGFCYDMHPEREIAIWTILAERYEAVVARRAFNSEERRDIYAMLVHMSTGVSPTEALRGLTALSADEATEILRSIGP